MVSELQTIYPDLANNHRFKSMVAIVDFLSKQTMETPVEIPESKLEFRLVGILERNQGQKYPLYKIMYWFKTDKYTKDVVLKTLDALVTKKLVKTEIVNRTPVFWVENVGQA